MIAVGKGVRAPVSTHDGSLEGIKPTVRTSLLTIDVNLARVGPEIDRPELQLIGMGPIEWIQSRFLSPGYGLSHPRRIAGTV